MSTTIDGVTYETVLPWDKTTGSNSSNNTTSSAKNTLDKDAFLKLLITQLKYQDPSNPVEDKEFMAQMASFSSLEQMSNLNTSFEKLATNITNNLLPSLLLQQSGSMVGREVTYPDPDDATASLTGIIESVLIKDGISYYVINGNEIAASSVTKVGGQGATIDQQLLYEILDRLDDLTAALTPEEAE